MESLYKYILEAFTVGGTQSNRILLFDVDDTLIHTTAKISIIKNHKVVKRISNSEYNEYILKPGESFGYEEFNNPIILSNEKFTPYWDTLKREYKKGTHIGILTARENTDMIYTFFKNNGIVIKKDLVFAIGDPKLGLKGSIAERKSKVISDLVNYGYRTFVFFDDNETNLKSAKELEHKFNIKIITKKV